MKIVCSTRCEDCNRLWDNLFSGHWRGDVYSLPGTYTEILFQQSILLAGPQGDECACLTLFSKFLICDVRACDDIPAHCGALSASWISCRKSRARLASAMVTWLKWKPRDVVSQGFQDWPKVTTTCLKFKTKFLFFWRMQVGLVVTTVMFSDIWWHFI